MTAAARRASSWDQVSDGVLSLVVAKMQIEAWNMTQAVLTLPLVCTRFRDFVSQQTKICNTLRLGELKSSSLPSLLIWLQQYAQHVTEYWDCAESQVDTMLGVLLSHQAPLQALRASIMPRAVHMIAAFTKLTTCKLHNLAEAIDLGPFQALEKLDNLCLCDGQFTNFQAAAVHLTNMEMISCTVSCSQACRCVTSLQRLCAENAELLHFHSMGLSACYNLEHLDCDSSSIGAENAADNLCFSQGKLHMPASLTALSKLTSLSFTICTDESEVTLDWVTGLTALQHLEASVRLLEHDHVASIVLPASWSYMTNLRKLYVAAYNVCGHVDDDTPFVIKLGFDWKPFGLLKEVEFSGTMHAFGQCRLTSLVSLARLEYVTFENFRDSGADLLRQVSKLACQLGKIRPDVACSFE